MTAEQTELDADGGPAQAIREIERLTRDATTGRPALDADVMWPDHVLAQITRPGDTLLVRDLERYQDRPARARGTAEVYDAQSFVALVKRWAGASTTLWASQPSTGADRPSIVAVLNDHDAIDDTQPGAEAPTFTTSPIAIGPGWGDHRVTLAVRADPDWSAWAHRDAGHTDPARASRAWMGQVALAEFLHDQLPNVVDPTAASLIDAVSTFEARQNISFNSAVRLQDGTVQMQWVEQNEKGSGTTELPPKLRLRLRPFFGAPAVELDVWLRYRIAKGEIRFGLFRHRPDLVEDDAWQQWCAEVNAALPGLPLVQGAPAGAVTAARD